MQANTRQLKELFQPDVRYIIPPFQRPYVWNQERQWEPLWEDVRNAAERYIDALESLDPESDNRESRAEELAGRHFLGAVVLQQIPVPAAEVDKRSIIDGQQRMTTLQLCLHAARNALDDLDLPAEASRLGRLVNNQFAEGDDVFKLWPAALDQAAYRTVMTDHESAPQDSLIVEAHQFFYTQVYEWLDEIEPVERRRELAGGLVTALLGLLEMVVIDLDSSDDPYVIFETLNARGTPLIASDLVKNLMLQTAHDVGLSADEFYSERWKQLEDKWWRREVRQGRLRRPRVDVFLNYWLVADLAEEVQSHLVFTRFREKVKGSEIKIGDIVGDVTSVAQIYRGWDDVDPWSELGTFLYRWRVLDAGVTTPLLLAVFDQLSDRPDELLRTLHHIESYLVRRMVTRMTTKDYNGIVLELVSRIRASSDPIDATAASYLLESDSESRLWPTDSAVRRGLSHLPLYRMLTRGRLRMVLEALEDQLRGPKTEDEFVRRGKLTIEHVVPQQWQAYWPPPRGDEPEEALVERERLVHSIGNLTLVTKSLNPALSNGPWADKQAALNRHGVLLLNSELVREYGDDWFLEDQIKERSGVLADRICDIWPRPETSNPLPLSG